MQSSTPLGPHQVNVFIYLFISPICPEPATPRELPALLAFFRLRVSIGAETFVSGLSCPFFGGGAFAPVAIHLFIGGDGYKVHNLSF
jgi:hypothetical protein